MSSINNDVKNNAASIGNASNPLADTNQAELASNQLLNKKAETYLREGGNIEDMPDDNDEQDMKEAAKKSE